MLREVQSQIDEFIAGLPEPKRIEILELHKMIQDLMPNCKLWFMDGKNAQNKIVANPNIGYGQHTLHYANGKSRTFYQIGISPISTGISVYIMGLSDKHFLAEKYGASIGKAKVTSYCITFKTLKDIHKDKLASAIVDGINAAQGV